MISFNTKTGRAVRSDFVTNVQIRKIKTYSLNLKRFNTVQVREPLPNMKTYTFGVGILRIFSGAHCSPNFLELLQIVYETFCKYRLDFFNKT